MLLNGKIKIRVQGLNVKIEQNLLNPLPLKLNVKGKIERNGLFTQTKVLIIKNKKWRVDARNIKVEIEISGIIEE
jgi:hypothetical protein